MSLSFKRPDLRSPFCCVKIEPIGCVKLDVEDGIARISNAMFLIGAKF